MKNKPVLMALLIVLVINLTGCWDSVELNERALISAIGIDKGDKEGEIILTFESILPEGVPTPSKPAGPQKLTEVVSAPGYSVHEALVKYKQRINKNPYFQHNRILIIGEDTAREGVSSFLNDIYRNQEYKTRTMVLVCKGKASDILEKQSNDKKISSFYLMSLIRSSAFITTVPMVDLRMFMMKYSNKTDSPVTARIEITKDEISKSSNIEYNGSAVFKKGKLAGWLNIDETNGLLWITDKFKKGIIVQGHQDETRRNISCQIIKSKTKIKPEIKNENITISIDISAEGRLRDNDGTTGLDNPEAVKLFESRFEAEIKNEVEACLNRVQKEYKTDVLGFNDKVHQKFPEEWKNIEENWDEIYPDIKVEVTVDFKLRTIGNILNSVKP